METNERSTLELIKNANDGDPSAQLNLGVMYARGDDVPQDYDEAMKWFKLAAEQGDDEAQFYLGFCYVNGYGVEKNIEKAKYWFELSAEQENESALLYVDGNIKSIEELESLSNEGDENAQVFLGKSYLVGAGVRKDYEEAIEWFELAAEQGNAEAEYQLGRHYYMSNAVLAMEYYLKAAEQGVVEAQNRVLDMYENGSLHFYHGYEEVECPRVEKDEQKFRYYQRLYAEKGNPVAQAGLGEMYVNGDGVEADWDKAAEWLVLASEQGNAKANRMMGDRYCFGYGVKRNLSKSIEYYTKAAEQGDRHAASNLGDVYRIGHGVEIDENKALQFYKLAAENGADWVQKYVSEMETSISLAERPSDDRFKRATDYLEKTKKMIRMDESRLALSSARNSLESIVKELGVLSGINTSTKEVTLESMINELSDSGIINNSELDIMHFIRMASNRGSHIDIDDDDIKKDDAVEVAEALERLLQMLRDNSELEKAGTRKQTKMSPMENPDYYSTSRKYYGMWANCMTKQELLVIPEYTKLLQRVKEDNDIEAMLNIAVGFLPNKINWGSNGLIDMPPYRFKGKDFSQDNAYDDRYYYWILKAVNTAAVHVNNRVLPFRYLATAMWEACLFSLHQATDKLLYNYVGDVTTVYDRSERRNVDKPVFKSTTELVKELFGDNTTYVIADLFRNSIRWSCLVDDVFVKDNIVAAVYQDAAGNTASKLRFIMYCTMAAFNLYYSSRNKEWAHKIGGNDFCKYYISSDYSQLIGRGEYDTDLIKDGNPISIEMLDCFESNDFCKQYLKYVKTTFANELRSKKQPEQKNKSIFKKIFGGF